ncbi:glutamate-5-semialdehyde dehydrogenase [Pedobacter sp. BS3]|uniref:glutamate-5-semialdehyde dehydrogenase n=1 Tax=Pedobacter sp. BS3 TaxID=2567937 RepID=UPI0011ED1644|nr:glutamate-5-semialdehyde dehydrogenase [Pedobacter sp. BS3]TZF84492.1 glutamate-5-semialdehyde dehydrogenase [Pedobacter sp. BS3]
MESILPLLKDAAQATTGIKLLDDASRQQLLRSLAVKLRRDVQHIIAENKKDLDRMDDADPKKDRLLLNEQRIEDLAQSLEDIALLPDPSNQVLVEKTLANGLKVQKKTAPLGVVGVIYESRPNVTIDVAALCIRSGNVCVLRGGSDAFYTNTVLVSIIHEALKEFNLDVNTVQLLPVDRKFIAELLTATQYVDILIPRGSQQLIDYVREHALVPVIETGAGVCHTYVEASADLASAADIVTNAKVSRPSVCNALDTVLVDKAVAGDFLGLVAPKLAAYDVEIFADEASYEALRQNNYPYLQKASAEDYGREFLDFKCSVKVVDGIDEALAHIAAYSSKHSEAIVSGNPDLQERFLNAVDAAAVYANASTRFTDGGVFGLGAEIGISTQKLHARGPFALEKLVTEKWFVRGNGQVR